ncbi:unnamed protein product [Sphagnum jensenii]|uniref:Uncharacterized protein n=1 Tax=Sphagnum jensenii TaxID=128206 RepID=A0ABP0VRH4_9BRYO
MVLLCFVLDVDSFTADLFKAIKQCLVRVGNLYALSRNDCSSSLRSTCNNTISICYTSKDSDSGAKEVHVVYKSKSPFDLREFYHKVISIPAMELPTSSSATVSAGASCGLCQVSCLSRILKGEEGLLSWGTPEIRKKVVMISGQFMEAGASLTQTILEAADQLVEIEFIQIEHKEKTGPGTQQAELLQEANPFAKCVSGFENCTFQIMEWDPWILLSLAKRWFQEIVTECEGPMEVVLEFPDSLGGDVNRVFCSFHTSILHIADTIKPCQTCRCHGQVITAPPHKGSIAGQATSCPVTGQQLDSVDLVGDNVLVGAETVFHLPSFKTAPLLPATYDKTGPPVIFKINRCIPLDSVDEGLCFGIPHTAVPSSDIENEISSGDSDNLEKNEQIFVAICRDLNVRACGLLCTSAYNIEVRSEVSFPCFYLLMPAQTGQSFVAKRIAAEEEILVVPQSVQRSTWTSVPDHITNSVASCLSKMWVRTYILLEHERGCHSKLIGLAKESLHFGSMKLTNPGPSPELPPAKALHISEGVELPGPTFEPEAGQNLQKREVLASIQALADATFPVSTEELTPRPTTRVHPHYLNSLRRRVVGRKAYLPLHPFPRDPAV